MLAVSFTCSGKANARIITLDKVKIGKIWLKDIPSNKFLEVLQHLLKEVKLKKIEFFGFWLLKTKTNSKSPKKYSSPVPTVQLVTLF